ncbi:MAG: DNA modification methylase [Herpetosiphon sp.]
MLQIVYRPLKALVPYIKNARTHSAATISKIAGSLVEFGWTNSMLVADNVMIAGHARLAAALQLAEAGHAIPGNPDPWQGPTVDLSHLSKAQRAAYVIADNRLAIESGWDNDILAEELGWLSEDGFDLGLTGFDLDEISNLLSGTLPGDGPDPDDIPETPVHPVTQRGDVWTMGKHRIICGDSTDPDTVKRVLAGVTPNLMVTDPPYGVSYDPADRGKARNADGKLLSTGNKRAVGKVQNDDIADWGATYKLFPGDVAYVWHSAINPGAAQKNLEDAGFGIRMQIVWAKSALVVSRGHYHMQHEPCYYSVRNGKTANWVGDRKQSTLWQIEKAPKNMTGHSTEKPVECMLKPIENNSSPGQAVYDPFVGSGTSIIACELSGRSAIAIEIDPAFVDVSILRWQRFTDADAIHEETGKTYAQLALERPLTEAPQPPKKTTRKAA